MNRSEFRDHPLYGVLRGEVLVRQGTQENVDNAMESVWKVFEEHSDWPEVQKGLAVVVVEALEQDFVYQGYNAEIPSEREPLLQQAKESIDYALSEVPNHPEYLFIKGRVQTLDGRFDAARRSLRRAIESLNPNRPNYERIHTRYRIELSSVDIQEQEDALSSETSQAISQLEELKEDYKNASQEFQTRILQFLGFFTGIIGIVVVTGQVAISVESTPAAIRLILILFGALLFSFGGFGFILPSNRDHRINLRIIGVLVSGAILILTGVFA